MINGYCHSWFYACKILTDKQKPFPKLQTLISKLNSEKRSLSCACVGTIIKVVYSYLPVSSSSNPGDR